MKITKKYPKLEEVSKKGFNEEDLGRQEIIDQMLDEGNLVI
jgi:predicted methyltransferase MtxX (methanogen marker protein 4)